MTLSRVLYRKSFSKKVGSIYSNLKFSIIFLPSFSSLNLRALHSISSTLKSINNLEQIKNITFMNKSDYFNEKSQSHYRIVCDIKVVSFNISQYKFMTNMQNLTIIIFEFKQLCTLNSPVSIFLNLYK
jgi:hypothetical protein